MRLRASSDCSLTARSASSRNDGTSCGERGGIEQRGDGFGKLDEVEVELGVRKGFHGVPFLRTCGNGASVRVALSALSPQARCRS